MLYKYMGRDKSQRKVRLNFTSSRCFLFVALCVLCNYAKYKKDTCS